MTSQDALADRYGSQAPWRGRVLLAVVVVVAAAFVGWIGWAIWAQATPKVQSSLVGYDVVDEHQATATVDVRLADDDVHATCTLRASAEDHTVVGEVTFTPTGDGQSEQEIRTERLATSVELVGCTAPGQDHPR